MRDVGASPGRPARRGRATAWAAAAVGGVYALISAYWALGGRWLIDTLGREFGRLAAHPATGAILGLWGVVALKLIACALPVMATSGRFGDGPWRALRALAVLEATILTLYGLVFSVAGWLVESGLVTPGRGADRRAEAWHAFLWDPWFLLWGLLVCAALRPARSRRRGSPT